MSLRQARTRGLRSDHRDSRQPCLSQFTGFWKSRWPSCRAWLWRSHAQDVRATEVAAEVGSLALSLNGTGLPLRRSGDERTKASWRHEHPRPPLVACRRRGAGSCWTLANERTLVAYERTALGLVVAGLAVAGSRAVADAPLWFSAIWGPSHCPRSRSGNGGASPFPERAAAMRSGEPLGAPAVAQFLPWGIAGVAVVGAVAALIQLTSSG